MTTTAPLTMEPVLGYGSEYLFNFAGCPAGRGTYVGTVLVAGATWLAFDVYDRQHDERRVAYYNPALLCTINPVMEA